MPPSKDGPMADGDTREPILATAEALFSSKGLQDTRVAEIAGRPRVVDSVIY